ncbi:Hypothetical predicted protein [Mytilus galloprovincialis]|uniref:EGF-like domain-containing protein n=1 Tax=Mytilus galloprovincialis TaxID=29158 RepID=A0A8B6HB10_MYTGA|nr:Hypothetical predicted protein [Mytilus galloprovincialis]
MLLWSLLFLCYSLLFVCTEGCRRSSDSSNKITVKVNNETIPENHRLFCTKNETRSLACLNGGSCFAVYIEDRTVQCACYSKYKGRRCEMIDPEIIFDDKETGQKEVAIGLISGFAASIFLFIVFVIIGCVWFIKQKPPGNQYTATRTN